MAEGPQDCHKTLFVTSDMEVKQTKMSLITSVSMLVSLTCGHTTFGYAFIT